MELDGKTAKTEVLKIQLTEIFDSISWTQKNKDKDL